MSVLALLFAIFLIFINGFFVAVEFAFTASRPQLLEEIATKGSRLARLALASMRELPVTFTGAQLGIAGASLALGFVMEPALGGLFEGLFGLFELPERAVVVLGVTLALLVTPSFTMSSARWRRKTPRSPPRRRQHSSWPHPSGPM